LDGKVTFHLPPTAHFDAISHHERLSDPRIQRYICGASLPAAKHIEKGDVRDLVEMRWKWLQLQRFSALLWNDAGRAEYFPHAMRALDALANFAPQEAALPALPKKVAAAAGDDQPPAPADENASPPGPAEETTYLATLDEILESKGLEYSELHFGIPPLDSSFYYAPHEPLVEWTEPPPIPAPTFLQLLLAEGAAIWLSEAMPAIRRYIQHKPLTDLEKTWFECAQESENERNERWTKWKEGLEKVRAWCADEGCGVPAEATLVQGVARALQAMARAECGAEHDIKHTPEYVPKLGGQVCLSCCA
jgi:hypothetical protein